MLEKRLLTNACHAQHRVRGYTMVELVTVVVIVGVLAAVAGPKFFDNNAFQVRGFYDQVLSTLRYAQKAAIAQNRYVCVAFTANSVTLTSTATDTTCATGSSLASPTGKTSYSVTSTTDSKTDNNVALSGYTSPFYFDALGRPGIGGGPSVARQNIIVASVTGTVYSFTIQVEPETGYVH